MLSQLTKRNAPEDIGGEPLLSVLLLESLVPVGRGKLEDALLGPAGEKAEQVSEVAKGLDAVELAAGEKSDEGGVHVTGLVGAQEEPIPAADGFPPQFPLRKVVVHGQPPILEETLQGDALVARVIDGLEMGVSSRTRADCSSHQPKKAFTTGLESR
jgi:hypothetical protein